MIKEGKISGLLIMVAMVLGVTALVLVSARLVLSRFKSDRVNGFKYDIKVTLCMLILINSVYIKFFANQFLKYRLMEYAPVISWFYIIGVLPYNIVASLICGIKGKRLILATLIGVIFNILVFILSIGVI